MSLSSSILWYDCVEECKKIKRSPTSLVVNILNRALFVDQQLHLAKYAYVFVQDMDTYLFEDWCGNYEVTLVVWKHDISETSVLQFVVDLQEQLENPYVGVTLTLNVGLRWYSQFVNIMRSSQNLDHLHYKMVDYMYGDKEFVKALILNEGLENEFVKDLTEEGVEPNPGPFHLSVSERIFFDGALYRQERLCRIFKTLMRPRYTVDFELWPDVRFEVIFADVGASYIRMYATKLRILYNILQDQGYYLRSNSDPFVMVFPKKYAICLMYLHEVNTDPRKIVEKLLMIAGIESNPGPFALNGNTKRQKFYKKNVCRKSIPKCDVPEYRDLRNLQQLSHGNKYETWEVVEDCVEKQQHIRKFQQQFGTVNVGMSSEMKTTLEGFLGGFESVLSNQIRSLSTEGVKIKFDSNVNFLSFITESIAFVTALFASTTWTQVCAITYLYLSTRSISRDMIDKFLEFFKKRMSSTRQQAGRELYSDNFFETIFYYLELILFKRLPTLSDFSKFFSSVFLIERGVKTALSLSDKVVRFVKGLANRISLHFMGVKVFESVEDDVFETWISKTEALLNPQNKGGKDHDVDIDEVGTQLSEGYSLQKIIKGRTCEELFKLRLAALQTLSLKMTAKLTDSEYVKVPFLVMLYGESGLGKSTQIKALAANCVSWSTLDTVDRKLEILDDLDKYIYHRNVETEFYDGLKYKHKVVVYDDAFQVADTLAKPNPELMEIVRTGGTAPVLPHMASLEEKGRFNLHFEFIILTSNSPMPYPIESVTHPEAVYRRLNQNRFRVTRAADGELVYQKMVSNGNNHEVVDSELLSEEQFHQVIGESIVDWQNNQDNVKDTTQAKINRIRNRLVDRVFQQQIGVEYVQSLKYFPWLDFEAFFKWCMQNPCDSTSSNEIVEEVLEILMGRRACVSNPLAYVECKLRKIIDTQGNVATSFRETSAYKIYVSHVRSNYCENGKRKITSFFEKLCKFSAEHSLVSKFMCACMYVGGSMFLSKCIMGVLQGILGLFSSVYSTFKRWFRRIFGIYSVNYDVDLNDMKFSWHNDDGEVELLCTYKSYVYKKFPTLRKNWMNARDYFEECSYYAILYILACRGDEVARTMRIPKIYLERFRKQDFSKYNFEASGFDQEGLSEIQLEVQDGIVIPLFLKNIPEIKSVKILLQEMYAKEPRKPRQAGLPRFLQEGCIDSQHKQSRESIERNTFKMMSDSFGSQRVLGMLVGIEKNYYLTFGHLMFDWNQRSKVVLQSVSGSTVSIPTSCVTVAPLLNDNSELEKAPDCMSIAEYCKWQALNKEESRDAVLIRIDTRDLPVVSSVKSHVVLHADLQKVVGSSANLSVLTPSGRNVQTLTNVTISADPIQNEGELSSFLLDSSFNYRATTEAGDCGAPLTAINPVLSRKFFGIHVGGSENSLSVGTSIYRELIDDAITRLDKVTIKTQQQFYFENKVELKTDCELPNLGDGVFVQGIVSTACLQPIRSKLRESEIYGYAFEPQMEPVHLKPYMKDGEIFDPLLAGIKKYAGFNPETDPLMEKVAKGLGQCLESISPHKCDEYRRVFTIEEAVFGIEGESSYGALDRSTSPGYSWESHMPGKTEHIRFDNSTGETWISDKLRDCVSDRIKKASQGIREQTIYKDTLKDEKKKFGKKTRVFSNGQMDYNIAVRMYFGGFMLWFIKNCVFNRSLIGINMYERVVNVIAQSLKNRKIIAGDFDNYDGTLRSDIGWLLLKYIVEPFYKDATDEERLIREVLWFDLLNSMHICRDILYYLIKSIPSGHPLTSIFNTIYNLFLSVYAYILTAPKDIATVTEYFKRILSFFYGDDNLMALLKNESRFYTYPNLQVIYKKLGHFYTDSSKQYFDETKDFDKLDDVTILKRYLHFDEDLGIFTARLEKLVIEEMSNWITKNGHPTALMLDNIRTSMREASLWSEEYYYSVCETLNNALEKVGCEKLPIEEYSIMKNTVLQ